MSAHPALTRDCLPRSPDQVWRGGIEYSQDFSRGAPLGPMTQVASQEGGGTQVRVCVWGVIRTQEGDRPSARTIMRVMRLSRRSSQIPDSSLPPPQVRFRYDETIFAKSVSFDPDTIRSRIR